MNKKTTNLILAISIIILIGLSGLFLFLINVIKNKNKHISAANTTLQEKIEEKDNIKTLEKKIAELGDTHKQVSSYLVDTSSVDIFVEYLERLGDSSNVALFVKSVETPKGEKNKLTFNIEMNGNFPDITKVISILENSPYSLNINSLYINKIIEPEVENNTEKPTIEITKVKKSSWQATANFTVLSF